MKKILLLASFLCVSTIGFSQEAGVRFGDVLGNDIGLDLILPTGGSRLHADLSFGNDFGLELLWDVVYKPLFDAESLHWYLGVGPSVLFSDPLFFGVSGELGLEYHFNALPIAVGADWRPTYWIVDESDFQAGGWGINLRFVF